MCVDFLRSLFKDPPEGSLVRLVVGSFEQQPKYVNASLLQVSTKGLTESLGAATNVWFAPAVLSAQGQDKSHVLASRCIWVDVDESAPPRSPFPPTFVVHSGHGYHYYYVLNEWLHDLTRLETINQQMAVELEGDVACYNCNRLLRVPDTINIKDAMAPVPVTLVASNEIIYDASDFEVLLKLSDKAKAKLCTGDSRGYRSRSERDWNILRMLLLAGASDDLCRRLAFTGLWNDRMVEGGDRYFDRTLQRAKMRQQAGGGTTATGASTGVIEEREDGYWILAASGGARRITTFRFTPTLLLEHPDCDVLQGEVRAAEVDHVWKGVTFTRKAFNSHAAFVRELPYASWQVLAGDHEIQLLLPHILKQLTDRGLPRVKATSVLGRHGDTIVGVNHVITPDGIRDYLDAPIVYVDRGSERPSLLSGNVLEAQDFDRSELLQRVLSINAPDVTYPLAGWFAACAFKSLFQQRGMRFPVLNVFGTRGSGKTTTIHLFSRLFGNSEPVSYDAATTKFVTLSLMGSINAVVPVSFSEFRAAHGTGILRFVLLSYDVGRDARGHADQTTTTYPLLAPIVIDGEDLISDPAAKERIIAVNMHPEDLTNERRSTLLLLSTDEVSSFAVPFLQASLSVNVDTAYQMARTKVDMYFQERIPDRIRNNLAMVGFGLETLGVAWDRTHLEGCLNAVYNAKMERTEAMVDQFVTDVVNGIAQRKQDFFWSVSKNVAYFHFATAFSWWQQLSRRTGNSTLARDALMIQMKERINDYMVSPQKVGTKIMYGVTLLKAVECGLDVPVELPSETEVVIHID